MILSILRAVCAKSCDTKGYLCLGNSSFFESPGGSLYILFIYSRSLTRIHS